MVFLHLRFAALLVGFGYLCLLALALTGSATFVDSLSLLIFGGFG